ncbi:MAG: hypothetical protein JWP57_731 [Spirosoma sp.]|nr:hypothetical protein [Spirosoma sp.]
MNYLHLARAFWDKHEQQPFTGNETLLYWRLVDLFNGEGEGEVWPEELRFMDNAVCTATGLSINTMKPCRKAITDRGLIEFESVGKGFRSGGLYKLVAPKRTPKRSSKRTSNSDKLPELASDFDELDPKDSQKDSQKEHQKDSQNLTFSYIYNNQTTKPSNLQTHTLFVADRDSVMVRVQIQQQLNQKKKKKPPRLPPPPPPINIPFDTWWEAYDKRIDKKACEPKWNRLTDEQRQAALTHTGRYVLETPNPKYRKNPETYLNRESWENEPLRNEPEPQQQPGRSVAPAHQSTEQRLGFIADVFAAIDSVAGK